MQVPMQVNRRCTVMSGKVCSMHALLEHFQREIGTYFRNEATYGTLQDTVWSPLVVVARS